MNEKKESVVIENTKKLSSMEDDIRQKFSVRRKGTNSKPYIFTNLKGEKVYIIK